MWFDRRKYNTGLSSWREYRRLLDGRYEQNSQDSYSPDEWFNLIRLYEEDNKGRLDKKQARREQKLEQIKNHRSQKEDDKRTKI